MLGRMGIAVGIWLFIFTAQLREGIPSSKPIAGVVSILAEMFQCRGRAIDTTAGRCLSVGLSAPPPIAGIPALGLQLATGIVHFVDKMAGAGEVRPRCAAQHNSPRWQTPRRGGAPLAGQAHAHACGHACACCPAIAGHLLIGMGRAECLGYFFFFFHFFPFFFLFFFPWSLFILLLACQCPALLTAWRLLYKHVRISVCNLREISKQERGHPPVFWCFCPAC